MKRTANALPAALAILAALALSGCASAAATEPPEPEPAEAFAYVHDWSEPKEPSGMVRIVREMESEAAESQPEAAFTPDADSQPDYWDGTAYSGSQGYDESLNNNPAYVNGGYPTYGDGFMQQGVREFEGRTETWYGGQAVYTDQLTLDEEGYYRDSEGRYAVAVSDMPEGTVFETSKGEAVVVDGGCDEGVTDFYVNFG